MFNFTTQTVYNKIVKWDLTNDDRESMPVGANLIVGGTDDNPELRIGNTRFTADEVKSIQVKNPSDASYAQVTFDFTKLLEKVEGNDAPNEITARIALYIGLSMNSQDSFYANDYVYKGKPFYIEFPVKKNDTEDILAARVKKIAKKFLLFQFEEKVLNITTTNAQAAVVGTGSDENPEIPASNATITFTGVDGYQQIKKAELQWYNPTAKTVDCCTMDGEFEVLVTGVPVAYKIEDGAVSSLGKKLTEDNILVDVDPDTEVEILPGLEAFGDYNWIIHNLRLPTLANTNFWSPTKSMDEMPIPGQVYTQFIITIRKERPGIMGEIVGAVGTSETTHVLYVMGKISDSSTPSAAYIVNSALTTLLDSDASTKMHTDADDVLEAPFDGISD